jgi:hypothetical protein
MSTITAEQEQKIRDVLAPMHLPVGMGTREEACSIAAINLALSGKFTDEIPICMSEVIGHWVRSIQDCMPDGLRNSPEWKALLPLAAGTGRAHEQERLDIILDHMWSTLPLMQPIADKGRFGPQWQALCEGRTASAASGALCFTAAAANAANAANASANATNAAYAAAAASEAAIAQGRVAIAIDSWATINPVGLLAKLIECGKGEP